MMTKLPNGESRTSRRSSHRAEAMLVAAGLQISRVERCPEPACPLCARAGRAAA